MTSTEQDSQQETEAREPPRSRQLGNPFSPFLTALYAGAWGLLILQGWEMRAGSDPAAWLYDPVNTAQRIVTRDLEYAEANEMPTPSYSVRRALFGTFDEALETSIAIQRSTVDSVAFRVGFEDGDYPRHVRANASLAVLLAEAGQLEEALEYAEQTLAPEVRDAIHSIYAKGNAGPAMEEAESPNSSDPQALEILADAGLEDWLIERPAIRLLSQLGDDDAASAISQQTLKRGSRWQRRNDALTAVNLLLVALGAGLLIAVVRQSGQRNPATRVAVPWSIELGVAVLIRADVWRNFYYVAVAQVGEQFSYPNWLDPFYSWGTLISSLPLLWLVNRHLVASSPGAFLKTFGMRASQQRAFSVLANGMGALAIAVLGTTAIAWGTWGLGLERHWAEGLNETLIWGSTFEVIQTCADYVFWTPVFEELAFRGLLFYSLRNRYSTWQAAGLSAAIFSAMHFYSLPGFLMTFWVGLVWAVAFERARSLWPGILAHSLYNLFFVLGILLFYR
jgi:membrane protease YdiL (CAAX protease family)